MLGVDHPEPLEAAGLDVFYAVPLVQDHVVVPKPDNTNINRRIRTFRIGFQHFIEYICLLK